MFARPKPRKPNTALQAPAILPRICEAAGWTQQDFVKAFEHNLLVHGNFNSISALLPQGLKALPADLPVLDVRRTRAGFTVELMIENERVWCGCQGTARITSQVVFPESVMDSLVDGPVTGYLGHKLLQRADYVIKDYQTLWGNRTIVIFTMPHGDFPA